MILILRGKGAENLNIKKNWFIKKKSNLISKHISYNLLNGILLIFLKLCFYI